MELLNIQNPWWQDRNWSIKGKTRILFSQVLSRLDEDNITILKGPRQTGKTFLTKQIISALLKKGIDPVNILYLSFDDKGLAELVEKRRLGDLLEEKRRRVKGKFFVFIDEFQKVNITEEIKLLFENVKAYKFFLSGSPSLAISQKIGESLLGRTRTFHLFPFSLGEIKEDTLELRDIVGDFFKEPGKIFPVLKDFYEKHPLFFEETKGIIDRYILTGGYPKAVLAANTGEGFLELQEILNAYLEKDILWTLRLGKIEEFRRLMEVFSHNVGGLVVHSNISKDIGLNIRTVNKYSSILKYTYIIEFLQPYYSNKITSIKKSYKSFFLDIGLRNFLSQTLTESLVKREKGRILENLVFTQLHKACNYFYSNLKKIYFWRNLSKNEVDFILHSPEKLIPVEVKAQPALERGLRAFLEKEGIREAIEITENKFAILESGKIKIYCVPLHVLVGI